MMKRGSGGDKVKRKLPSSSSPSSRLGPTSARLRRTTHTYIPPPLHASRTGAVSILRNSSPHLVMLHGSGAPFQVNITTKDDVKLHKYNQTVKDTHTTCYIESRPGEEWCILVEWDKGLGQRGSDQYCGFVHVDGKQVERFLLATEDPNGFCRYVRSKDLRSTRPFVFQTLQRGDSDDEGVQRLDEAAAKGLGSIVVVFEAGTFTTADCTPPPPQPAAADPATLKVHEKSKKRASEVTTFGAATAVVPPIIGATFTSHRPSRTHTFTFLYRSAILLELEHIVVIAGPPPVFDPVVAEQEWNRLQLEMAGAATAAPVTSNQGEASKGKRAGEGRDEAAKKVKKEIVTIEIGSSDEDDDDVEVVSRTTVKKEGEAGTVAGVKTEKGSAVDLTSD